MFMKTGPNIKRGRTAGFTLLETVVALSILAIGILAIVRLFPMAMREQYRAAERTTIAELARTEMGRVRAGGVLAQEDLARYVQDWLNQENQKGSDPKHAEGEFKDALYTGFQATATPVMTGFDNNVNLYRVTFTVDMSDGRQEQFVTYVTEF